MGMVSRPVDRENPSPINSPKSNGSSNSINNGGGLCIQNQTPPITPKPISRSEINPSYPTTFVQADTTTFKQVVQMLTGSPETANQQSTKSDPPAPAKNHIPPIRAGQKKQGFKLYERRNQLKNGLMINPHLPNLPQNPGFSSSRKMPEILSPSILDFPALNLSPVTPLIENPFDKSSPSMGNSSNSSSEEDKAIAEKGFYLHPSPRTSEPRLLPLFPVTSPRVFSGNSA